MERDLAGTVARMGQVLTAGGEEKQWLWPGDFPRCCVVLGMQGTDGKSSGGALTARPMSKAAGREGLGSSA